MIRATLVSAIALSCLAAATSAQVSPSYNERTEGNTYSNQPFGQDNANGWRFLQLHDDLKGKNQTIRGLAFRRDGTVSNTPYMAFSTRMTVICSTAATTVATLSNTFDANHGGNKQTVVSSQEFNFPPTLPGYLPAPFTYVINFQNPYAFNGTNGGLCWEVQITQQTNLVTTVYLDFQYSQSTNPQAETDTYGEGCIHSSRTTPLGATCSTSFNWTNKTGTLYLNGNNLPVNSLALGVIGFSRANYGPFPLPWTFPGSASQYSGPCNLYTSLDILLPGGSSTSGTAQVSLPIPLDAATMNGLTLYGQYMSPDLLTKAAIKFTTSNGTIWNFVAPYTLAPGGYVLANTTFAATGTSMNKNYMYVTQLL